MRDLSLGFEAGNEPTRIPDRFGLFPGLTESVNEGPPLGI